MFAKVISLESTATITGYRATAAFSYDKDPEGTILYPETR